MKFELRSDRDAFYRQTVMCNHPLGYGVEKFIA